MYRRALVLSICLHLPFLIAGGHSLSRSGQGKDWAAAESKIKVRIVETQTGKGGMPTPKGERASRLYANDRVIPKPKADSTKETKKSRTARNERVKRQRVEEAARAAEKRQRELERDRDDKARVAKAAAAKKDEKMEKARELAQTFMARDALKDLRQKVAKNLAQWDSEKRACDPWYGGIGITTGLVANGGVKIAQVFPGYAAESAGLAPGDILYMPQEEIRGAPGTVITVDVERPGYGRAPMNITREKICLDGPTRMTIKAPSYLRPGATVEAE